MDAEDTPSILSVGSSLLAVACAVSSIPMVARVSRLGEELAGGATLLDGKVLVLEPLAVVQGRQRLLRGSNEVFVGGRILALGDLVEFFIELLQLGSLGHKIPKHELRGLVGGVPLVEQKFQTVVDQSKVQEKSVAGQTVATVANDLDTTFRVISIETGQDLMVRETVGASFHLGVLGSPFPDQFVVFLDTDELHDSRMRAEPRTSSALTGTESWT